MSIQYTLYALVTHKHIHTHIHAHTHTHTHTHTYIHTHKVACAHVATHAKIHMNDKILAIFLLKVLNHYGPDTDSSKRWNIAV